MASTNRPVSPHLQIYKPQLTSILSITHRATGVFNSIGALLISAWLYSIANGIECYTALQTHLQCWVAKIIIAAFVFSLFYHLCNGIRHLFWDAGKGLDIGTVYKTGYACIFISIVLTATALVMGGLI